MSDHPLQPGATRFARVRAKLEAAQPTSGWRSWVYEFLLFGFKQGWACLFGALMLALLLGAHLFYPDDAPLARNDFVTLAAIAIQIGMLAFRLENWEEARVILAFHVTGTIMEQFKTQAGSWNYPAGGVLHIGLVPLYSGFMYAAVGSYIARIWRIFGIHFDHWPSRRALIALAVAIYVNFFSHHWLPDIRDHRADVLALALLFHPVPPRTLDAGAARLLSGRPVHLVCREFGYLRPCLVLPQPASGLGDGEPRQARLLVSADDHIGRDGVADPSRRSRNEFTVTS
jgi:hypothetical protein